MPEREKFSARMDDQLKHLKERIEKSKSMAENRGGEFFEKYEEDLTKLESKYDLARYKLSLLRTSSASAWHELRDGFEKALNELKAALTKAKDKF
jgi:ribosomal protein S21